MVVAAQYDGCREATIGDGAVEGQRDFGASLAVGIEDAGLRAYDQLVAPRLANPVDVVVELPGNLGGRRPANILEHLGRDAVGCLEVLGLARGADPAEGSEAVVEEHRAHDVLHVGGIAEASVLAVDRRAGARSLQQEGVAVVEEVHAAGRQLVDGVDLAAQRLLDAFAEAHGLLDHHLVRGVVAQPHGVVTARPGVVQRGLVRTEVDINLLGGEALPEVDDVAHVGQ